MRPPFESRPGFASRVIPARRLFPVLAALFLILAPLAAAETLWHSIAKGETIYSIAKAYGLSPGALILANGNLDPAKLKIGQRLLIPATHRVEKGETLFSIAKAAGTTVQELRKLNGLSEASVIRPGDLLVLPSSPGQAPKTQAAPDAAKNQAKTEPAKGQLQNPPPGRQGDQPQTGPALPAPESANPSGRAVPAKALLPCAGTARYLEGKVFGIAIRGQIGAPIKAVSGGSVVSAGPYRGFGSVAFVQSRSGLIFVYGGSGSLEVKVGDSVKAGQTIGTLARDPITDATDAFFFVFAGGKALDPATVPRE